MQVGSGLDDTGQDQVTRIRTGWCGWGPGDIGEDQVIWVKTRWYKLGPS